MAILTMTNNVLPTTYSEERSENILTKSNSDATPNTTGKNAVTDDHQTLMKQENQFTGTDLPKKKKPYGGRPLRFQCPDCERKFHAPSHLKRHMLCHTSERPFQCHVCKKGFLQAWHLGRHMTIHTGNKPFRCSECPKTFGSRFEMKTHCNYIHKGIKEHECEVCKKMFTLRSNLKVHMRKHTGEKPYECQVCSKRFGQRGHLQYHMRKHEVSDKSTPTSKRFSVIKANTQIMMMKEEPAFSSSSSEYGSESEGSLAGRASPTFPSMISSPSTTFHVTSPRIKPVAILKENPTPFKSSLNDIPLSGRMFDHTNPREIKPFVCVSCNCGFGEISSIRAHARHSHARNGIKDELFSCAYCCTTFASIDALKFHFEVCRHKISTSVKKEEDVRPMKRSLSEEFINVSEVKASKRPFLSSPNNLSTCSDTTWDRVPSVNKSFFNDECPYECNCSRTQRIDEDLIQSHRYLQYLEFCQNLLESHVQFMEKVKRSKEF